MTAPIDPRLIHAVPLPILVIGQGERIDAANALAQNLLGSDCTGWHYVTALRQPGLLDQIEASFRDGGARTAKYLSSDGARDKTWRVAIRCLAPGPTLVLSFEDMTAMEDAGQMRRDFVANVSHELRTPLTALLGFIETLKGPARDDAAAQNRFLTIMEQEAGRMHRLVEDLLSLSRVEDLERQRPVDQVDLGHVLGDVVRTAEQIMKDRGATIDTAFPGGQAPKVRGDADQLRQVFNNLVENALKYGREGGHVRITMTAPGYEPALQSDGVRITVSDDGPGIAAHHIARLTERFYRIDTHRSRAIGGTGLGLAIVKHIINRHRGRLRVESQLGEGSSFIVLLPV